MNKRWIKFAKILIIFFSIMLFINATVVFMRVKSDMNYFDRAYGLSVMDDNFNNGEYYKVYVNTLKNKASNEELAVDCSQYEAFGRLFNAYINAKTYKQDKEKYIQEMENEKLNITWTKILTVVESLENDLKNN